MKKKHALAATGLAIATLLLTGCASQSQKFAGLVRKGSWAKAVEKAQGDSKAARGLAVAVIESQAASGNRASELVTILAGAGREGRAALERLVENDDPAVSALAFIAVHRRSAPSEETTKRLLEHRSSNVRAAAAQAWFDELEPKIAISLLADIDPRVRLAGVFAVAGHDEIETEEAAALLSDRLRRDPSARVRAAAARRGDALGSDALSQLMRAAEDENLGVRLAALTGLARLESRTAVDVLRDEATGPLDEMTVAAAAELAALGDPLGIERMVEALHHESRAVRLAALLRLERADLPAIEEKIADKLDDEAADVVVHAASMLARRTEDPETMAAVRDALDEIYEESGAQAARARDLLAALEDPEALEAVRQTLRADDEERVIASLRRVRGVEPLQAAFLQQISNDSPRIRLEAAIAIVSSRRY